MIAILDNGKDYSDHRIHFITVTSAQADLIKAAFSYMTLSKMVDPGKPARLLGIVESIEWHAELGDVHAAIICIWRGLPWQHQDRDEWPPALAAIFAQLERSAE
jgi:hypothetical protein